MPLIVVANSPNKEAALAGLERWKSKQPKSPSLLAVDDVLVDSMRGRSSTWTRIRVNLRHVPEELRPPQETPDPDDDPTREWRARRSRSKRTLTPSGEDRHQFLRRDHFELRIGAVAGACRYAIGESAPCAGNGCPACVHRRLPPPTRAAAAPTKDPCPGSSGSGLPACAGPASQPACVRPRFQG